MSMPLLEIGAEILHTCLLFPCRTIYELVFVSARSLVFCIFGDIWALRDPIF